MFPVFYIAVLLTIASVNNVSNVVVLVTIVSVYTVNVSDVLLIVVSVNTVKISLAQCHNCPQFQIALNNADDNTKYQIYQRHIMLYMQNLRSLHYLSATKNTALEITHHSDKKNYSRENAFPMKCVYCQLCKT